MNGGCNIEPYIKVNIHKKNFVFVLLTLLIIISPIIKADKISVNVYEKANTLKSNKEFNNREIYELLIITPKEFKNEILPLVRHKEKLGILTRVVTLNEIYKEMFWEGGDKAEKIKYFIKEAIEKWGISYVLLIGGRKQQFSLSEEWWLPVRYSHLVDRWGGKQNYSEEKFISDLYYADIYDSDGNFSSWDTNGNGVYGEWNNNNSALDIIDLYPDVYLGRLPCRNRFEVMIMVNKIINYETETYNSEWFKRMVVVAGDLDTENDYNEGEVGTQKAIENMSDFNHIKLWTSLGTLNRQRDVIKEINKGCGFIFFYGHGSPLMLAMFRPGDNERWVFALGVPHMLLLRNKNKLPICVVCGCHNSLFNISIFHPSWTQGFPAFECWSWVLTRKIGGGSIATIGSTSLGYGEVSKKDPGKGGGTGEIGIYFFGEYGQNGIDILGKTWGKAVEKYLQNFPIDWNEKSFNDTAIDAKVVESWILFGDPTLKIGGYK